MGIDGAPETHPAAFEEAPTGWWSKFVRRKGHIGRVGLTVLTIAGCLPFLMAFSRIFALPWAESLPLFGFAPLRVLGDFLNQYLTLDWVPPSDRPSILYLMLLPTGALLVTVARLTLGVRVLGLRAILLAMGFKAIGFMPSLSLMFVVVGAIVTIRPWIRRIRLPMYARTAVILCLSSMIMVSALMLAPWFGSETVWSVAFFPVIIMAMLAEGIAKTLEKDNLVTAVWRPAWTIVLALFIALVGGVIARFVYRFPELILTELVAVVFIAEFFDLRLLEKWPARLARYFAGIRPWYNAKPKVAVVRNRETDGFIGQLGRPAPSAYRKQSVQRYVKALREQGFEVKVFEGDMKLLSGLSQFLPADQRYGTPGGIVLNLATGLQGEGRFSQVPAMLELAGVAYTGPDPVAHAQLADRLAMMTLLGQAGVPVPRHSLISDPAESADIDFPGSARPRLEPDANRIVVKNRRALRAAVREFRSAYAQPTVVEEIVKGREFRVALLGNEILECLPILEYSSRDRGKVCPAPLEDAVAEQIRSCARAAYRAARCRDYARIDIRLTQFGEPVVVDVKWVDLFARRGAFATAAEVGGYTFPTLMRRVVTAAAKRYLAVSTEDAGATGTSSVVSLADRRAAAG